MKKLFRIAVGIVIVIHLIFIGFGYTLLSIPTHHIDGLILVFGLGAFALIWIVVFCLSFVEDEHH